MFRPTLPPGRIQRQFHAAIETLELRRLLHAPEFGALGNQFIPAEAGNTLHVPLSTNYDHSDRVRYSAVVTSSEQGVASQFDVGFRSGDNTWIRMETSEGVMDFQLFDDIAPRTVDIMLGLIKSGFFNGQNFHRVVPNFVIQGGDPQGDGTGGPSFRFDDEFHPDGLFTGSGQLAMANSGKDTNGSQFFVTTAPIAQNGRPQPPRFLDFNHTVWGQLVRGFSTRDRILAVPTDENGMPTTPVIINRVSIIGNRTDAVLFIRANSQTLNKTATVTVTANSDRGASTLSFNITGVADTTNNQPNDTPPVLSPVSDFVTPKNKSLTFALNAYDVEGNAVEYAAELLDKTVGTVSVNQNTKLVVFTPNDGFTGPVQLLVGVKQQGAQSRGSTENPFDIQNIQIGVGDMAVAQATAVADLDAAAGVTGYNFVLANFTDSDPTGSLANWTASINWGDNTVTGATVRRNSDGSYSVLGDHTYANVANDYPVTVTINGDKGARAIVRTSIDARDIATLGSDRILVVNGSSGDDLIGISSRDGVIRANINGVIKAFSAADVGRVEVYAYDGQDRVFIGGGVPVTYVDAAEGDDFVEGGEADDTLTGGAGKNTLYGGRGDDRINGSGGRDLIFGQQGDDRMYGNGGSDTIDGGGGVNRAWGGDGNDLLIGGGSNDKLRGEAGDDTLIGNAGSDLLNGGDGTDSSDDDDTDERLSVEILL